MPVMLGTTLLIGIVSASYGSPGQSELQGNSEAQQGLTVTGKVSSGSDKSKMAGVTVQVKGTTKGTITNADGEFNLSVPSANATLIFSFIGFKSQEVPVNGLKSLNVVLAENTAMMDEVVVTALGITRQEKSLGYAVAKVSGEDMSRVVEENAINALEGKVAGVEISSTGGTGSSVSMIIRGATSLSTDNQPLFVVDGVPVTNTLNNVGGFGNGNVVDYGNAISDLNSNDIESVSVLKGPSAAALYGSRAGNGVVLITTKSGLKNKGIKVNISSNTLVEVPYQYYGIQKQFANGYFSYTPSDLPGQTLKINPAEAAGAGIEMNKGYFAIQWDSPRDANGVQIPTQVISHPNNVANFVQTGLTSTNGVSVSANNGVTNYRIGASNMTNHGTVPNSDLNRNNLTSSVSLKANDKLTISSNIEITQSWAGNRPSTGTNANPIAAAYWYPQSSDIREMRNYWLPGQVGQAVLTPDNQVYDNPYFLAHQINNSFNRNRVFGNIKADWQITKEISLMARYSLDTYNETRESKIAPGYSKEPNNGTYGISNAMNYQRNMDILATYAKQINHFSLSFSVGGNSLYLKSQGVSNSAAQGAGLIVPNLYTLSNIKSQNLNYGSGWSQKGINSVYALANLGWEDKIYLDLTARNDWSSTLPVANRSYFYPSASLSILVNKLAQLGDQISLLKVRGGIATVGNDTSPYQLTSTYGNAGQWGNATQLAASGQILSPNLKPESATSKEGGIDLGMFNNRLKFEGTYYQVDNSNQIVNNIPIASSTGASSININAGLIESKGIELVLGGVPVKTKNVTWNISTNWTRNRTTVVKIAPGVNQIQFWSDAKAGSWAYVGDQIGSIYDAAVIKVTDKTSPYYGYPIISPTLDYEWQSVQMENTRNKIGSYNPNFIMGLQNSISYKSFTLSFTLDWRNGGQFISKTERYMTEAVNSKRWLHSMINPGGRTGSALRDWLVTNQNKYILNGFHIVGGPTVAYGGFAEGLSGNTVHDGEFCPGVIANGDGTYTENLGGPGTLIQPYVLSDGWDFAKIAMLPSDNIKLRELSISYKLPHRMLEKIGGIQDLSLAIYTRNIVIWTKAKVGVDPERAFEAQQGGSFSRGIEYFNVNPWTFPIGVKFDLTF